MAYKKRRKTTRFRGSHTHGRGFKKKARGSGHQGGKGMAGTGKRGDAKKTMILNLYGNDYFGKSKTLRRGQARIKMQVVNIQRIAERMDLMTKNGSAKDTKAGFELDYSAYKIIGVLESKVKLLIKAAQASQGALESVKKAGGDIILPAKKEVKVTVKPAKAAEPAKTKK